MIQNKDPGVLRQGQPERRRPASPGVVQQYEVATVVGNQEVSAPDGDEEVGIVRGRGEPQASGGGDGMARGSEQRRQSKRHVVVEIQVDQPRRTTRYLAKGVRRSTLGDVDSTPAQPQPPQAASCNQPPPDRDHRHRPLAVQSAPKPAPQSRAGAHPPASPGSDPNSGRCAARSSDHRATLRHSQILPHCSSLRNRITS